MNIVKHIRLLSLLFVATTSLTAQEVDLNSYTTGIESYRRVYEAHWVCTGDTLKQYHTDDGGYYYEIDGFWMSCCEITQDAWEQLMGYNPSEVKGTMLPVTNVTRAAVDSFMHQLSNITGLECRLPTREEWLLAYHGGIFSEGYAYAGSNNPNFVAWTASNSGGRPHEVEQLVANEVRLNDMMGNVAEMVTDGDRLLYMGGSYLSPTPPNCMRKKTLCPTQVEESTECPPAATGFRVACRLTHSFKDVGL